ncbi:MAG: hypothetical protein M3Y13_11100, partial [Armatimonadota bacterium]|nr:hypothetical protein [Armatimonadota bacterium]
DHLLRGEYSAAAAQASRGNDPESLAIKAFAMSRLGDRGGAKAAADSAAQATAGQTGRARALALIAQASVQEQEGGDGNAVRDAYIAGARADPTLVFGYSALEDFYHRTGNVDQARKLLSVAADKANPQEKAVISSKLAHL